MNWVVYALLALNLGLLTWNLHTRAATGAMPAPQSGEQTSGAVNQLPLLTELDKDALRLRVTATVAATPPSQASTAGNAAALTAAVAPASTTAGADSSATPLVTNVSAVLQPNPAIAGSTDAEGTDAVVNAVVSRACLTLGPLGAEAPVADIRTWLQQAGAAVDVRIDERREVALYWVYFPPRITRKIAVVEVERLRAEGVTDVIVVPKGDMTNAISLGVFSRTDSRDRRVKEMKQRGYQPAVAPRYRVKRATWIDVSALAGALLDEELQSRWPAVEIQRKPCGGESIIDKQNAPEPIAVGPVPSYNASPPAPHRPYFSGSDASRSSGSADASP